MKKGKSEIGLFGSEVADPHGLSTLSADDEQLLDGVIAAALEKPGPELVEHRFRKHYPDLHFKLRNRFGSYAAAKGLALKRVVGSPIESRHVLSWLRELYATGQPVTLESLVQADPARARVLVEQFSTLPRAWAELGVDAATAGQDRRWERVELYRTAIETASGTASSIAESELASSHPLFCEALRLSFGSFKAFRKEFLSWLSEQSKTYVLSGRWQLSKMLAGEMQVTSRGAKGKKYSSLQKVQGSFHVGAGHRVFVLTNLGLLYPVDSREVPFSTGNGDELQGYRLQGYKRGEKPVSVVSWGAQDGYLALITRGGRLKIIDLKTIRRVRSSGLSMVRLVGRDRLACAAVIPHDFERIVVLTAQGRAVSFEPESIRPSSRRTMGVMRIRYEKGRKDEPVAVLGLRGYDDVLLMGKNGNLLRFCNKDVATRKGASMGRRVWRSTIAGACVGSGNRTVLITTKKGRFLAFGVEDVPRRQVARLGVIGIRLDSDDSPESVLSFQA